MNEKCLEQTTVQTHTALLSPQYLSVQHLLAHLILTTILVWVLTFHMRRVSHRWVTHWTEMTQHTSACVKAQSLQSFSNRLQPYGMQPVGTSVHGLFQARTLEWVVMSFSRGSSQPGDQTWVSCSSFIAGRFFMVELSSNPSSLALEYLLLASALHCLFCYQKGRKKSTPETHIKV